ncbi:MAG: glycogen synthase [Erysipelotrichaceae bacterium]
MKKILFAASEGLPFVKTGGLADVVGSLPQELSAIGFDVSVIIPLYLKTARTQHHSLTKIATYPVVVGSLNTVATLYSRLVGDVTYYLVEHAGYFEREGYYGYPDDGERFAFFQHAILRAIEEKHIAADVLHCHDWHTGFLPLLCKTVYLHRIPQPLTLYTIHNLAFQGNFPYGLLESCIGVSNQMYFDGTLRFHEGMVSFMKAGILYADAVTTVSETYAHEILTSDFGEHMEDVLRMRKKDLYGIVNGIDVKSWNPTVDTALAKSFDTRTVEKGKAANKAAIQAELGLRQDPGVMLVAMVSRLTPQKGIQILMETMHEIMGWDMQLIILGTGDNWTENELRQIEYRYPRRAVFYCGYHEELAHRIYAGADMLLMPSAFEPCGISQLIAMHYGTLPLVRETGGLKDTVEPYNEFTTKGTGFTFTNFNREDFKHILKYALDTYYRNPENWKKLVKQAMKKDVSWSKSAKDYAKLIERKAK